MEVRPIRNEEIELVSKWMAQKENYQWLDFGSGTQVLKEPAIRIMNQREIHHFRIFTADDQEDQPIGLVALSDISTNFHSATLWYVLGEKKYNGRQYTSRAVREMLTRAFDKMHLKTVYAWAIEQNRPSIRILEKNNFRMIGVRRKCHKINGRLCNRLLFDLLSSEHKANY